MKKTITILLFLLVAGIVTYAQTGHKTYIQKSPNKIIVTDSVSKQLLDEIAQGKAYLVDVRTPEEYALKHLKYAQNANLKSADFANQIAKLDKNKQIYLYCHSGNRSAQATDSLLVLGYKRSYNIGGLDSLVKVGFPVNN
jgi:phage shock protein E